MTTAQTIASPDYLPVEQDNLREWVPGKHRCESRCGAEAFAAFAKGDDEILLCNHHRRRHEDALIASGYRLEVNPAWEEIVNVKPSV